MLALDQCFGMRQTRRFFYNSRLLRIIRLLNHRTHVHVLGNKSPWGTWVAKTSGRAIIPLNHCTHMHLLRNKSLWGTWVAKRVNRACQAVRNLWNTLESFGSGRKISFYYLSNSSREGKIYRPEFDRISMTMFFILLFFWDHNASFYAIYQL